MIEETLRELGLSKNEARIYIALIESGPSLIGRICGRTKIHRRNVYDSVEMLKDKGFVSSTMINNRNVFEAVGPERILDILDEKRTDVEKILPQLLIRQNQEQTLVRVYTGLNGRKIVFEDKLKYPDEQYVIGAHAPSVRTSPFLENYHRRRIKKKIPIRMLFMNWDKKEALRYSGYKYIKARLLPDRFSSPIAINIYGDKTAIFLGSGTTEPISILIENKGLSDDFRSYFNLLWSISKPLK